MEWIFYPCTLQVLYSSDLQENNLLNILRVLFSLLGWGIPADIGLLVKNI